MRTGDAPLTFRRPSDPRPGRGARSGRLSRGCPGSVPLAGRFYAPRREGGAAVLLAGDRAVRTTTIETAERGRSPLGSHIRFLLDGPHGNMIHSIVPPGMVGRACRFRTVDEFWAVLAGEGEMWRRSPDGRESITRLTPGVCLDIPVGTAFQYRCSGSEPLVCIVTAMPPWPGDDEAEIIDGPWPPRVDPVEEDLRSVPTRD